MQASAASIEDRPMGILSYKLPRQGQGSGLLTAQLAARYKRNKEPMQLSKMSFRATFLESSRRNPRKTSVNPKPNSKSLYGSIRTGSVSNRIFAGPVALTSLAAPAKNRITAAEAQKTETARSAQLPLP